MEICFRLEYRVFIYIGFDSLLIIFDRNWWKFEKYLHRFIYRTTRIVSNIFFIRFAQKFLDEEKKFL